MSDKIIDYKDLQLELESYYLKKIEPVIQRLSQYQSLQNSYQLKRNQVFRSLLNQSFNIDEHYHVKRIVTRVNNKLGIQISLKFYLNQNARFRVTCIPNSNSGKEDLYLFVSQHFFNNLIEDEQVGILGHEIAHYLLGHLKIPILEIINKKFGLEEINGLKSDLLNWSKSCEISADLIGLASCDFNFRAYSTAIIKYLTGLSSSSNSNFNISPLLDMTLKKYEQLANDPLYSGEISTHPLYALRVKIINSIAASKLIKNFGDVLQKKTIALYRKDFNAISNNYIKEIYPEMMPGIEYAPGILPSLMIAVALADGVIDRNEIKAIKRMISGNEWDREYEDFALKADTLENFNEEINKLIDKGVKLSKEREYEKNYIVPIIRNMLIVAASDGEIELDELNVIYKFAKEFGLSRQDIMLILETHHQIFTY